MQTEFAKEVGSKYDLARGIEGSVAKHERVKRFYGLVNGPAQELNFEVPRPPRMGAFTISTTGKNGQGDGFRANQADDGRPRCAIAQAPKWSNQSWGT